MNAIVTGLGGFAGRMLAGHLLSEGDRVLGITRRGPATIEPALAPWVDPRVAQLPVVGWRLDQHEVSPDQLAELAAFEPEVIYHLAAVSLPSACGADEPNALAWQTNVEGTRRILELAAALPPQPRVLLVSSSQVYAPVEVGHCRVDENAPLGPTRGYGRTKLAAEALAAQVMSRQAVIVARSFQHTGPGQSAELMLSQWARQLVQGGDQPVEVYTRDAWIDLCDVRDVVRAYRLLAVLGKPGVTYNVGSGIARSSGSVLDELIRSSGTSRSVRELRPGTKQDPIADCRRLVETTGWTARVPLAETVADTWNYWWRAAQAAWPSVERQEMQS